jgi:disulfide bond formation protein DsbB
MTRFALARRVALLVPAALLLGAYGSQYIGGLVPCEMCWWQRYPHFAAVALALLAFALRGAPARTLVALAAVAIVVSGGIGIFHAGVEYHWWEGVTRCTVAAPASGADFRKEIMNAPIVRCDQAQWTLFGISLAGWNAIVSIPAGLYALWLLRRA